MTESQTQPKTDMLQTSFSESAPPQAASPLSHLLSEEDTAPGVMIQVTGLDKYFDQYQALKALNLQVKEGSIYGLLGSNGAGKTTLLKTLAGIYREDGGTVTIDGQSVFDNIPLKQRLVFVPDALYFFPGASIDDMAQVYRQLYPGWNQQRYEAMAPFFHMKTSQKVHQLSKGMQRQVACWLALAAMPEVLILDEPLDGLDSVMRQKVKNLLVQEVADRQMTILISSHNLRELEDFCDHVGILHQGTILLEKEVDDLKQDIHKIQVAFRNPPPGHLFESLHLLHHENRGSVNLIIARGSRQALMETLRPHQPVILDILPLTLEEIFIYEMGDHGYAVDHIIFT